MIEVAVVAVTIAVGVYVVIVAVSVVVVLIVEACLSGLGDGRRAVCTQSLSSIDGSWQLNASVFIQFAANHLRP